MTTATVPTGDTARREADRLQEHVLSRVAHWPDDYLAARLRTSTRKAQALRAGRRYMLVAELGRIAQALGTMPSTLAREAVR